MQLQIQTPATVQPLTLSDAKTHLGVTDQEHDVLIDSLIAAASEYTAKRTGRTWAVTTYNLILPCWQRPFVELPRPPLQSIASIQYYDTDDASQTYTTHQLWASLDSPGRIYPAAGEDWPAENQERIDAITIQYVAGYGLTEASFPGELKQAIRLLIRHWYDNPSAVASGTTTKEIELSVASLMNSLGTGYYADV